MNQSHGDKLRNYLLDKINKCIIPHNVSAATFNELNEEKEILKDTLRALDEFYDDQKRTINLIAYRTAENNDKIFHAAIILFASPEFTHLQTAIATAREAYRIVHGEENDYTKISDHVKTK